MLGGCLTAHVSNGSWSCENDLGSPKSSRNNPRIGQEDRREQFFPVDRTEATPLQSVLGQLWGSQMRTVRLLLALPTYAAIASITFSTPTIFSTRVKL